MPKIDETFCLVPLGDIHYGSPNHDREEFLKHVKQVVDTDNYFTMGMGDYIENNVVTARDQQSKAFSTEQAAASKTPLPTQELREFREIWKPLAVKSKTYPQTKTVGLHIGNHEDRMATPHDMFKLSFTEPLGVEYLGDFAMTDLLFMYRGKPVYHYVIVSAHGSRIISQVQGTVITTATRKFAAYDYDVALFGHTHYAQQAKTKIGFLDTEGEAPVYREKKRLLINTGSFVHGHVEGFDAYTDKAFGSLRDIGTVTVKFDPYNKNVYAML